MVVVSLVSKTETRWLKTIDTETAPLHIRSLPDHHPLYNRIVGYCVSMILLTKKQFTMYDHLRDTGKNKGMEST